MAEEATKAEAYRQGTEAKCCALCTMFRGPNGCIAVRVMAFGDDGICNVAHVLCGPEADLIAAT
jgi:hypothetical protein